MAQVKQAVTRSAQIRKQLGHPVIDCDGHVVEPVPLFADFVRDHGHSELVQRAWVFKMGPDSRRMRREATTEERRLRRMFPAFWTMTADTEDFATVTSPAMYYERLGEAGIDFAFLYPSLGLSLPELVDDDQRVTLCRLYNEFMSEIYGPYADRFTVPAVIPMHSPDEAIAGMEHAVGLGAKVALIPSYVNRPLPTVGRESDFRGESSGIGGVGWLDTYGIDSAYDYDPVWAQAIALGLPLSAHSLGMGFTDRASISNYMYNHIGHFAAVGEALAKSLFFGGVTQRFPRLRLALLEGGVLTGVRLYSDLVGHWQKRGGHVIDRLNPANIDGQRLHKLLAEHDPQLARYSPNELVDPWGSPDDGRDDFAAAGVLSVEDIRDRFCPNFCWGCEADDPFVGLAFDPRFTPLGARVPAIMGSDIGHWDVPQFDSPLAEAYELVESGILNLDNLRDFLFTNPLSFYSSLNPSFFNGTAIETWAQKTTL